MQISDLLQLQSAARTGQTAQAPTADTGRPPPSAGAVPSAVEGFGSQLRRAIERQASAAAQDAALGRRPEPAGGSDEPGGLEALDASLTDAEPGTPADAPMAGLQAPFAVVTPALDAALARSAMPEGLEVGHVPKEGLPVRASPPAVSRAPATSVEPMPSTTDVLRAAAVRAAPSDASGPVDGSSLVAAGAVEGRRASAQAPAMAPRSADVVPRGFTDLPAAPVEARVPGPAAGRVGASSEAEVGAALTGSQAMPGLASASSTARVALPARAPFGEPSLRSPPVALAGGKPAPAREPGALRLARHPIVSNDLSPPQGSAQFLAPGRAVDASAATETGLVAINASSGTEAGRVAITSFVATEPGRVAINASWPVPADVVQTLQAQPSPGPEAALAPPARGQLPLRTTALGPAMDLVVGDEPDPDMAAVLSYARDSGLGAQALKRLFGGDAAATAGPATAATSASAALASPVAPLPAASAAALPASPGPQAGDPAVMSMAAWIGGRAGPSAAGGRLLTAAVSPARTVAPVSDRVDLAGASLNRPGGFEPTSSGLPPATPAAVSPTGVPPAATVAPPMVNVPGGAVPASHADLALRLARATATRMVAELRQGNGSLRLQIEPASLGKVDIDMTLRQGALEATLVAHQSVTRELLVDGLPRLRDTLMQLGMNVAGVDVKSGFSGQSDGKSTNQQNKEIWYSARRATAVDPTLPVDGGDQRRSSRLDLWA